MRAEIATAIAAASAAVGQGRAAATGEAAATLAEAAATARATVQSFVRDFYERKIFEPYLRFSSAEDEAEYRKREEGYRKAIDAALAEGTTRGDLKATELAKAQLVDAGAHGADRSPEFAGRVQQLDQQKHVLEKAIAKDGAGTSPVQRTDLAVPTEADITNALLAMQSGSTKAATSTAQDGHGLTTDVTARARGRV